MHDDDLTPPAGIAVRACRAGVCRVDRRGAAPVRRPGAGAFSWIACVSIGLLLLDRCSRCGCRTMRRRSGGGQGGGRHRGGGGGGRTVADRAAPVAARRSRRRSASPRPRPPISRSPAEALGSVTPAATVTVIPQVSGTITQVLFREGQLVRKGQTIAIIDPRPYRALLLQAQGALIRDKAQLENARCCSVATRRCSSRIRSRGRTSTRRRRSSTSSTARSRSTRARCRPRRSTSATPTSSRRWRGGSACASSTSAIISPRARPPASRW